jgi:hypothetical protein
MGPEDSDEQIRLVGNLSARRGQSGHKTTVACSEALARASNHAGLNPAAL